ncbi:hypothetical protein CCMA1212_002204 [Trichoderma ghanense]|uniref:Secreted protein n=1 Tax=Trichoderma ghanense TaxID=65468 RepID=A0ABY2HDQ7_9HYPO
MDSSVGWCCAPPYSSFFFFFSSSLPSLVPSTKRIAACRNANPRERCHCSPP